MFSRNQSQPGAHRSRTIKPAFTTCARYNGVLRLLPEKDRIPAIRQWLRFGSRFRPPRASRPIPADHAVGAVDHNHRSHRLRHYNRRYEPGIHERGNDQRQGDRFESLRPGAAARVEASSSSLCSCAMAAFIALVPKGILPVIYAINKIHRVPEIGSGTKVYVHIRATPVTIPGIACGRNAIRSSSLVPLPRPLTTIQEMTDESSIAIVGPEGPSPAYCETRDRLWGIPRDRDSLSAKRAPPIQPKVPDRKAAATPKAGRVPAIRPQTENKRRSNRTRHTSSVRGRSCAGDNSCR